jgi:hypothetical protein
MVGRCPNALQYAHEQLIPYRTTNRFLITLHFAASANSRFLGAIKLMRQHADRTTSFTIIHSAEAPTQFEINRTWKRLNRPIGIASKNVMPHHHKLLGPLGAPFFINASECTLVPTAHNATLVDSADKMTQTRSDVYRR